MDYGWFRSRQIVSRNRRDPRHMEIEENYTNLGQGCEPTRDVDEDDIQTEAFAGLLIRWMELVIDCVVFVAKQRISRDRRHLRSRCQPRSAIHHGRSTGSRDSSCETTTLQSTRYLSDHGAALELVDDRTSDVARVPAREANHSQGPSSIVLRCAGGSCGSGNDG